MFLNTFRDTNKKWPRESFTSWVTVQHYLVGSPNVSKICYEILQTKKYFIKPSVQRLSVEVCKELLDLRQEFLKGNSEENCLWQCINSKWLKAIVGLVLMCIE